MDVAIAARGLGKAFGEVHAVSGVDLDLRPNEVLGVVGPDGAGKTTLLRLLVGVLAPDAGTITVCGLDLHRRRRETRLLIGYMSQAFSLYPDLTVAENIRFFAGLRRVGRADRIRRATRLLEATGLAPFTRRFAGALSGGMKQKLGLVCTLVHEPQVLLLDEPTNGVDPVSRREFWEILGELRERISILVTTPSLDEAERCDRVGLMVGGSLNVVDTPAALRDRVTAPVWEVEVAEPFAAAEALEAALPEQAVQLFGDRLHVVHEGTSDDLRALLGDRPAEIRRIAPSLEDAYVQILAGAA